MLVKHLVLFIEVADSEVDKDGRVPRDEGGFNCWLGSLQVDMFVMMPVVMLGTKDESGDILYEYWVLSMPMPLSLLEIDTGNTVALAVDSKGMTEATG